MSSLHLLSECLSEKKEMPLLHSHLITNKGKQFSKRGSNPLTNWNPKCEVDLKYLTFLNILNFPQGVNFSFFEKDTQFFCDFWKKFKNTGLRFLSPYFTCLILFFSSFWWKKIFFWWKKTKKILNAKKIISTTKQWVKYLLVEIHKTWDSNNDDALPEIHLARLFRMAVWSVYKMSLSKKKFDLIFDIHLFLMPIT